MLYYLKKYTGFKYYLNPSLFIFSILTIWIIIFCTKFEELNPYLLKKKKNWIYFNYLHDFIPYKTWSSDLAYFTSQFAWIMLNSFYFDSVIFSRTSTELQNGNLPHKSQERYSFCLLRCLLTRNTVGTPRLVFTLNAQFTKKVTYEFNINTQVN